MEKTTFQDVFGAYGMERASDIKSAMRIKSRQSQSDVELGDVTETDNVSGKQDSTVGQSLGTNRLHYVKPSKHIIDYTKNIRDAKRESALLSEEKLNFLNGRTIGEVSLTSVSGEIARKVRRIVEKRVHQNYWHLRKQKAGSNYDRYMSTHRMARSIREICGTTPCRFDNRLRLEYV